MDLEKAEKTTKAAASKRQIRIELSDDQMRQLDEQYKRINPAEAAELIFTKRGDITAVLKVAGYSYSGDTCCV